MKSYYISKTDYTDDFGTKDVISPKSSDGNDRFYIMALDNITSDYGSDFYGDNTTFSWYYYGNLDTSNNVEITANDFGTGKEKTITMKTAWDAETYGEQYSGDIWNLWIAEKGEYTITTKDNKTYTMVSDISDSGKWFVPSKSEILAFGDYIYTNEGVTQVNYSDFGLCKNSWTSAQRSDGFAYYVRAWGQLLCI